MKHKQDELDNIERERERGKNLQCCKDTKFLRKCSMMCKAFT